MLWHLALKVRRIPDETEINMRVAAHLPILATKNLSVWMRRKPAVNAFKGSNEELEMKRTAYILATFLLAYPAFFVWHTPLRSPLSDTEIDAFLTDRPEAGGTDWAISDAFEAFLRADDGRPFVMINFIEIRDVAAYPDWVVTDYTTGAEADTAYGRAILPLLLKRGSYPVAGATRSYTIINSLGQPTASFDKVAMVRYRSRRDLIDMITSEAFLSAEVHKWASLENTLVAPASRLSTFNAIGYAPIFMLALMVIGGLLPKRKRQEVPQRV